MTRITDEAVRVGRDAYQRAYPGGIVGARFVQMCAALEAALPHLEGATPEWTDEERGFVETALAAADAGNAGHWPTVATYLAAEVRRLRALDGATPAIDREALALAHHRFYCHARDPKCGEVDEGDYDFADVTLALIGGAS